MYEEQEEENVLVVNAIMSQGQIKQLVVIVDVCRLVNLKRVPAPPLTLF